MKTLNKIVATGMIALLGTTALAPLAYAEQTTASTPTATTTPTVTQETITASDVAVSGTGRNVITGVEYAKAAIDQGQTDVAQQILADLSGMFGDQDGTVLMKTDGTYALPLDTGLTVAEGFTPTQAHETAFTVAQTQMADGNIDQVITTLTDAGVDLVAQVALLPYTPTIDAISQAAADLQAGQIDQATATLQSITASVHVATFATDALPAQGYDISEVAAG